MKNVMVILALGILSVVLSRPKEAGAIGPILAVQDLSFHAGVNLPTIQFGDEFSTQGYLYEEDLLATECPETRDCGVLVGGQPFTEQPEFPEKQIGRYFVTGHFFANPLDGSLTPGEEVGRVQVILQFFDGSDLLVAEGLQVFGDNESHSATLAVLGGTGRYAKARGELIETMVTKNASGAFTFRYDLSRVLPVRPDSLRDILQPLRKPFQR